LEQWDDAIAQLTKIPENHAESTNVPQAYYELGWAQQKLGKSDEALQAYEQAATESRGETGARARFMMGELYFEQKKHAEAVRQFQRVMYGYGGELAPASVKTWQAKSGFEAGRCAEVQAQATAGADRAKHISDARKHYQFVVEKHPQDSLAAEAKKRLETLSTL
jgi:TolA-binding protein